MTTGVVSSLVRRAAEAGVFNKETTVDPPRWAFILLSTSFWIFVGCIIIMDYTFGRVIPALVMIESPSENITFEPLPADDADPTVKKATNPEPTDAKPKAITASIRSTIRLLTRKGGFRAWFRGISIHLVTHFLINLSANILSIVPFIPRPVVSVLASVMCAQLLLTWTHIVISEPSPKTWFRRLPPMSTWKKVALPTAILAVAEQLSVLIPLYIGMACNIGERLGSLGEVAKISEFRAGIIMGQSFGLVLLAMILGIVLVLPVRVAVTRVQASLLSDTEETIVPFDRTFGGKVVPEIVGGTGVIGTLDAWKTFEWTDRVRLLKTIFKVFLMQLGLVIAFVPIFFVQIHFIISRSQRG